MMKGNIMRRKGQVSESLKYFKLCHVIDEHNPKFLKQVAKTLRLTEKFKTALSIAENAENITPNDWEITFIKG